MHVRIRLNHDHDTCYHDHAKVGTTIGMIYCDWYDILRLHNGMHRMHIKGHLNGQKVQVTSPVLGKFTSLIWFPIYQSLARSY